MATRRTLVLSLAGVVLGAILLWVSTRSIDLSAAWSRVATARPADLAGIVFCGLAFGLVKAIRAGWLLQHLRRIRAPRLFESVMAGSAVNYGVPHAGELVRAWMLARTERVTHGAVLASIGVERLFDFVGVLVVVLAASRLSGSDLAPAGQYLWVLAVFIAVLLAGTLPFVLWPRRALALLDRCLVVVPSRARRWLGHHAHHAVAGLGALQSATLVGAALAASILQWTLMVGCAWFSMKAVGIDAGSSLPAMIVLFLVVGLTLPAAPGHVGTTQAAFVLAGAPFALDPTTAIAGSLVYNLVVPATFLVPGLAILVKDRLRAPARPGAAVDAASPPEAFAGASSDEPLKTSRQVP